MRDADLVSGDVSPSMGHDVMRLWQDEGVQRTWAKKVSFAIMCRRRAEGGAGK